MIEVPVLKDIRSYETKLVGSLTTRQTICVIIAVGLGYGVYTIEKFMGIENTQVFPMFVLAFPPLIFGWIKPYGLKLEVYLKTVFIDNFVAPKVRIYQPENPFYEYLKYTGEDITQEEFEAISEVKEPETETETGKKGKKAKKNKKKASEKTVEKVSTKNLPPEWHALK